MPIERFDMERMQSTWENLVEYDMSESGVRPLTLRELVAMGFDLDEFLDQPLGYSQSNGTVELRERIARLYPGTSIEHIEVTNGTSEANYLVALSLLGPGDRLRDAAAELHADAGRGAERGRGRSNVPVCCRSADGNLTGTSSSARSLLAPGFFTSRIPTTRPEPCLSESAMARIVERCDATGTWLLADEVYLGAEIDRPSDTKFLGHERSRHRHERPVQGLRDPGGANRLDRGAGDSDRRLLDAARLSDNRAEQDVRSNRPRCGGTRQSRALLRPNAREF